jgi:mannosyltransferase OCH1-like enzyme
VGALSNNILGSEPEHRFWRFVTHSLRRYDWNYLFPYITISYASGQWFLTSMWEQYHQILPDSSAPTAEDPRLVPQKPLYRVIMDSRSPDGQGWVERWVFFNHGRGESWRDWDNDLFTWIGDHVGLVVLGPAIIVSLTLWSAVRLYQRLRSGRARYERLKSAEF